VALDDAHQGWLANYAGCWFHADVAQFLNQGLRTQATCFFIVGERKMHWPDQGEGRIVFGHGQAGCNKTFHVAGTSAKQPTFGFSHAKWIRGPVLA